MDSFEESKFIEAVDIAEECRQKLPTDWAHDLILEALGLVKKPRNNKWHSVVQIQQVCHELKRYFPDIKNELDRETRHVIIQVLQCKELAMLRKVRGALIELSKSAVKDAKMAV